MDLLAGAWASVDGGFILGGVGGGSGGGGVPAHAPTHEFNGSDPIIIEALTTALNNDSLVFTVGPGGTVIGRAMPRYLVMSFGANANDVGRHLRYHGRASPGDLVPLDPRTVGTLMRPGTLRYFAWNSASATAATLMKVKAAGIVVADIPLTGPSGVLELATPVGILAGEGIAVEFDSGPNPNRMTCDLVFELPPVTP